MRIGFYAGSSIPIHAHSLDERPLGGTETGLIRVAEALSKKGHEVVVFTAHLTPPPSTPKYLPAKAVFTSGTFDLLVLIQEWKGAFFNLPARRLWVWTGDGVEQLSNYGIGDKRVIERVERLLVVSSNHQKTLCEGSGFPIEKTVIVSNGVFAPYFEGFEERNKRRLIFTSAPYRGLALVPKLLIEIQRYHPDAEFHCFSGMDLYDRERPFEGPQVAQYRKIAEVLRKVPHAVLHGNVTQRELAREYMKSAIYFYPNTVPETCCITALEAQAAGCALITSSLGALPETVGDCGYVVPGDPSSDSFMSSFIDGAVRLLADNELCARFGANGKAKIAREGLWEHVAERMEAMF